MNDKPKYRVESAVSLDSYLNNGCDAESPADTLVEAKAKCMHHTSIEHMRECGSKVRLGYSRILDRNGDFVWDWTDPKAHIYPGAVCMFDKSGRPVRLMARGAPHMGQPTWTVEALDGSKSMTATESGLSPMPAADRG